MTNHTITFIPGDGIGPEVTNATRKIIDATGVKINWELCEAGAVVFKKGLTTGVPEETIASIARNKIALKGPLETPVGFGEKSANVTLRKMFETFANIRPVKEFPGVITPYSGRNIDLVIVRENVEDLYAGIEHMQTPSVAQCLKLISRKGCEKVIRLAFEFARSEKRKMIHCATKANIMKATEGMMKRTFEEIALEYPDIESHHIIIDNCAHQMVKKPEQFDVIVTTNMNGDILSDLGSALIGGLGLAPSSNIGDQVAIFEAVHGSAPKYAGQNNINPSAVLLSGVMMLRYIDEFEAADAIENALIVTMARDKILPRDICGSLVPASTTEFTDAIIRNLGQKLEGWRLRDHKAIEMPKIPSKEMKIKVKTSTVNGVDIFIGPLCINNGELKIAAATLQKAATPLDLKLKIISNRGVKVFPEEHGIVPDMVDCFRCRFVTTDPARNLSEGDIMQLVSNVSKDYQWTHIEKLNVYDGVEAYSKDHGED